MASGVFCFCIVVTYVWIAFNVKVIAMMKRNMYCYFISQLGNRDFLRHLQVTSFEGEF